MCQSLSLLSTHSDQVRPKSDGHKPSKKSVPIDSLSHVDSSHSVTDHSRGSQPPGSPLLEQTPTAQDRSTESANSAPSTLPYGSQTQSIDLTHGQTLPLTQTTETRQSTDSATIQTPQVTQTSETSPKSTESGSVARPEPDGLGARPEPEPEPDPQPIRRSKRNRKPPDKYGSWVGSQTVQNNEDTEMEIFV